MTMPSKPAEKLLWLVLIAAMLAVTGIAVAQWNKTSSEEPPAQTPPLEQLPAGGLERLFVGNAVPGFTFTERDGRAVLRKEIEGNVCVVHFFFTSCAGICPHLINTLKKMQPLLEECPELLFLSVSVDPERDTLQQLTEYADKQEAHKERWLFLRGEKPHIVAFAKDAFKLGVNYPDIPKPDEEEILHSRKFVLLDRQGRVRGYYDSFEAKELQLLEEDIRTLIKQK